MAWTTPPSIHDKCGEEAGYEATRTIDGITAPWRDSVWIHDAYERHWIIFDLGETKNVTRIRLFQHDLEPFGGNIGFRVYVSDDPTDFGTPVWEGPAVAAFEWQECVGFSKSGRYIKVESLDNKQWQYIIEFQAYVELAPPTYTLTISATPGGTTNPPPGPYQYAEGDTVTVEAIPDLGYNFDHWELNAEIYTDNPIPFVMPPRNITLHAVFVAIPPAKGTLEVHAYVG